ncbi:acyl- thioesterase [Trichoderma cornu-damae]|uniref:Acyl- thioesterase n=1 Tax=Trichoderma cornu-damae TaxID=654480 RepID=A0A9P8QJC0_9HYPO|nr:acyl- thioesterase [Trichoderma cornu-damae]
MVADLPLNTIPPTRPHTHTVIFLHDNHSLARTSVNLLHEATDLGWRSIIQNFASTRWVFPQAPTDQPLMPSLLSISTGIQHVAHAGEPSWWSEENNGGDDDASTRQRNAMSLLAERVQELQKVIRSEVATLGGRWDKVILGGIGDGAGMAMWTLMCLNIPTESFGGAGSDTPNRLGCFVGLSCEALPPGAMLSSARQLQPSSSVSLVDNVNVLKKTPMLMQCFRNAGEKCVERSKALRDFLVGNGVEDVCWKEYADGWPKLNSPRGVEDMKEFLRQKMGMTPNF